MQNDENQNPDVIDAAEEANQLLNDDNWSQLSSDERKIRFESLSRTEAEEFFLNLGPSDQYELLVDMNTLQMRSWLRLLAPDDAADLIQEAETDKKDEFLSLLDPQTKREVSALLAYAEDEAGGLMNSRFIRLRPNMNVDEGYLKQRFSTCIWSEIVYEGLVALAITDVIFCFLGCDVEKSEYAGNFIPVSIGDRMYSSIFSTPVRASSNCENHSKNICNVLVANKVKLNTTLVSPIPMTPFWIKYIQSSAFMANKTEDTMLSSKENRVTLQKTSHFARRYWESYSENFFIKEVFFSF